MTGPLKAAVAEFHEHGYVVLPAYLGTEVLQPAQSELDLLFPTAEEFHAGTDPERNARFSGGPFAGIQQFPYESVEWSLLGLCPALDALAVALLGTPSIRLYEAHNWAKYGGATEYEQLLHRDFVNHGIVPPANDPALAEVEMFVYIHDVPVSYGPTYAVSQRHTADIPFSGGHLRREDHPDVYAHEVAAEGPAGTVLAYKTDTFHRGSGMSDPKASRFVLKVSFRTVSDMWIDRLGLTDRLIRPEWLRFLERATPRQLELVGFPPRGHHYWTEATWLATSDRYPTVGALSDFRPE
jgi:ectoine hydroxylase-related dioxygenase (phytanoyl-CoA dioxygenase family)